MDHALSGVHSAEPFMRKCIIYGANLGTLAEGSHLEGNLRLTALGRHMKVPELQIRLWEGVHLGKYGVTTLSYHAGGHQQTSDVHLREAAEDEGIGQVKPGEVGNDQEQENDEVLHAAVEDQDWLDATGVLYIRDRTVFTERREFVRLDPGSDAFFRVFEYCKNATVERRRVAWDAAVLKILRARHALRQNRVAVARLVRVERERANGRERAARSYANRQLAASTKMAKGPWLSSEEVASIELMDNQALKRPIHPVTVGEIAGLLAKGKKRGEIMELIGISRYAYHKAVKRLKLEGAATKPSEEPEAAQGTAIPAPQLAPLHPQSAPVHQHPHRAPAPQQNDITPGPRQPPASALRHEPHAPELQYIAHVTALHHNSHTSALQQQYAPHATIPQYSLQDFLTSPSHIVRIMPHAPPRSWLRPLLRLQQSNIMMATTFLLL
ncbi:uncharacterized protein PITG_12991 [Phytophthora infestans T30-4]|uniref:Uncharacterized protein n=1 Tax=Phytophthora infestans (strain T30-4) TaxID=403677 RepID=D0NK12_PHYIT|nr:uncharacterized protein PITG_12991 [Phytophthora infestans T30-4]EEY59849.1 conserved hypothetical protein [Phytophthora infestans T30-4]|eukprot:XP_002900534.1 conserved hypothetical protein [Phytophthora infestans T30-4]